MHVPSLRGPRVGRRQVVLAAALLPAVLAGGGRARAATSAAADPARADVAREIVAAFDALFGGPYAGYRPVHTKGVVLEGEFTPTAAAAGLSRAVHFGGGPVPAVARFSDFAGVPTVADAAEVAAPRGMAIKFKLPDGGDTDIVAHSYDGFPAASPEDFRDFLRALAAPDQAVLRAFLAGHPAARTFVDAPKPPPASFATEAFFGVNALAFANAAGRTRYGRYRIEPVAGRAYLDPAPREPGYLAADLTRRLQAGPVAFRLLVQLAAEGDDVTDGSVPWPAGREVVDAGTLRLRRLVADSEAAQRELFFTPLNLVDGIASSGDPMLAARTRAYRIAFARRHPST